MVYFSWAFLENTPRNFGGQLKRGFCHPLQGCRFSSTNEASGAKMEINNNVACRKKTAFLNDVVICVFALGTCLGTPPVGAQNRPADATATMQQAPAQSPDQSGTLPGYPAAPPQTGSQGAPPAAEGQMVPLQLTLPAGTIVSVRTAEWLSSDRNRQGDSFSATLDQPVVVNGWVVARRGQAVMGRVNVAQKAGRVKGVSQLGLELNLLSLVDGQQLTIQTGLLRSSGGTSNGRDAAAVGAITGVGAVTGAAADGGTGAAIGAGAGAVAGLVGVLTTRGKPTVVSPETVLSFQLETPITIATEHGRVAFRPVTQADYQRDQDAYAPANRRPHLAAYPPPPPPYLYGCPYCYDPFYYSYPGWGFYPGPVIGFYGGFRGGSGRGFRR
jgi:hypothetical protein